MNNAVVVIFAIIFVVVIAFVITSRSNYSHDHPILNEIRANFGKLRPEYANIPLREGDSSYTENKASITMCLKDKFGKYYDMNTLHYVALHELAHMTSKTVGHNDEFRKNFTTLLKQAHHKGFYNPRKEIPHTYCGTDTSE